MQTDMHYYGTYALARAAGINGKTALEIATAAQFVDDFKGIHQELRDNTVLTCQATAHGTSVAVKELGDTLDNCDRVDQRHVWSPFHFLPGCEGVTVAQKLICQKDSNPARAMIGHRLGLSNDPFAVPMIGITAHVYADTFSHYGFAGISHEINEVNSDSIKLQVKEESFEQRIREKARAFWETCEGFTAEKLTQLGHGGAATFPDRPYLNWHFQYADGRNSGERSNQATFFEACEKLHALFSEFAKRRPDLSDGKCRAFAEIAEVVKAILALEGEMDRRIGAWQDAVQSGQLFDNADGQPIPVYKPIAEEEAALGLSELDSGAVKSTPLYSFIQAAEAHRNFVNKELLPTFGLKTVLP